MQIYPDSVRLRVLELRRQKIQVPEISAILAAEGVTIKARAVKDLLGRMRGAGIDLPNCLPQGWTESENQILRDGWMRGDLVSSLLAALPRRTRNAIHKQAKYLKLPRRIFSATGTVKFFDAKQNHQRMVEMAAAGVTPAEIAEALDIGDSSVRKHLIRHKIEWQRVTSGRKASPARRPKAKQAAALRQEAPPLAKKPQPKPASWTQATVKKKPEKPAAILPSTADVEKWLAAHGATQCPPAPAAGSGTSAAIPEWARRKIATHEAELHERLLTRPRRFNFQSVIVKNR